MTLFFRHAVRYPVPHPPLHPARYGLAIVMALVFSLTIFQVHSPSPDPTSLQDTPAPWRCLTPGTAHADVAADFNEKFNALTPPENSSVHSDYLFEQIALGSRYTILQLEQIKEQAAANNNRFQKLSEQLDTLIEQNQQIIDLLKKNYGDTILN